MCVNLENGQTTIPVRSLYCHTAVEATWAQERFVQPIWLVGRSDDHDRLVRLKAVHLHKQLVQGLLTLVIAIDAGATLPTDGIDFIDEDDAGSRLLGLVEEVTHPAGADTDQHFDKLRAAHREERHFRLTCHSTGKQGLTGSRRPYEQHTTRDFAAQALEFARRLQKFHHLHQIVFGFIHTSHIRKGSTGPISWHNLGSGLPKAEGILLALSCPATNEEDHANHYNEGEEVDENGQQGIRISDGLGLELHVILVE